MNEDGWYTSFVPKPKAPATVPITTKRRETVNEGIRTDIAPVEGLLQVVAEEPRPHGPPAATIARRAKSYSDFYDVVRAHIKRENRVERQRQRKLAKRREIKDELDFGTWYSSLRGNLLDASCEDYQLYHDQLDLAEQHLSSLLTGANSALTILSSLSRNFKAVDAQTTAFQAQCEDLLNDQKRTLGLADSIAENLQYYTYLEPMTRRLNAPGAGRLVGGRDFSEMLSNLDACLEYMQAHPKHRESATYKAKYRLLLTRALTLIRNTFANALKDVVADVTKRLAERQLTDTTQSALLYAKFRVPAPEMKAIGLEIQKRAVVPEGAEPGSEAEYQSLMNELYQSYGATRGRLLRPIIAKKMAEFAAGPSTSRDLVAFARSSMSFIRGLCVDEFELWCEWFNPDSNTELYPFLEELIDPLFDYLRPRVIHETQIQKLCDLCTMIQTRYLDEDSDDGSDDEEKEAEMRRLDFAHLVLPALEDAQSRLVFLTQTTLRNEIENFKPKSEDLDYPARAKPGSKANGPVLSGRKLSNSGPKTPMIVDGDGETMFEASLRDSYPTLRRAVWLLGRIYRLVDSSVFDDLAHAIVHATTASLIYASTLISKQTSPTDAHLFLISHLLTLKQQIVAFDIEFVSPDVQFDFSAVTNTFHELQNSRGGLFNPLNWARLLSSGGLIPKVVTNMLDAKAELDGQLRGCINDFVSSFADRMTAPIGAKHWPVQDEQKATGEVRKAIEKTVPFLRRKVDEYINDVRTRETLVAAVLDKVVENYEDWYDEWSRGAAAKGAKGNRKGKGREDEIWGPGAFAEWAGGVFEVGRMGFSEDDPGENGEDDVPGASSRESEVDSL